MTKEQLHDVTMTIHAKTQKALLLSDDGEEKNAKWLPLSQIETESVKGKPDQLEVAMPMWLAIKSGLV